LQRCRTDGYRVSVAVVERSGVLKVLLRDDNTGPHTVNSSMRKAYTSASLGRSTQELATMVAGNPEIEGLRQMDPQLLILAGGLPIVVDDAVIGGIGVGGAPGGQLDEACAQDGVNAVLEALGAAPAGETDDTAGDDAGDDDADESEATATPAPEPEPTGTPQA
jgi:uncharacterized protein GlcG (DUF336 family)